MSIIIPANSAASGGFEVSNSLRFDKESSAYLNKTLGTPTLTTKNTISVWFKKTRLGSPSQGLVFANGNAGGINLDSTELLQLYNAGGALKPNRVFRDTSAWYHVVVATDTTLNTADDRLKMYINGVQETSFATRTNPSQNAASNLGTATAHVIGCNNDPANYFSGYMSECVFIDGTALAPTSFGEFDEDSGIWKPISVSGLTFGNNGFYLKFGNSGALGTDSSGEGNTFAVNNLAAINQTTDTPTNNFAILNYLAQNNSGVILKEGNTKMSITSNVGQRNYVSTIAMTSGKWYFEAKMDNVGTNNSGSAPYVGVFAYPSYTGSQYVGDTGGAGYNTGGYIYSNGGGGTNTGTTYTNTDVIGCAVDLDNNKIYWSKNGTYVNAGSGIGNPSTGANGYDIANIRNGDMALCVSGYNINAEWACNFGNPYYSISSSNTDANDFGNFEYTVPTGYFALCSKNLSEALS